MQTVSAGIRRGRDTSFQQDVIGSMQFGLQTGDAFLNQHFHLGGIRQTAFSKQLFQRFFVQSDGVFVLRQITAQCCCFGLQLPNYGRFAFPVTIGPLPVRISGGQILDAIFQPRD